jgi:hypothetical protein
MSKEEEKQFVNKMTAKMLVDSYAKAEKIRKIINDNEIKRNIDKVKINEIK